MLVAAFAFTSTASAAITSTLKLGSNNSQVKELQQGLNSKGFVVSTSGAGSVGSETNYFGSKTKTAVQSWQASKGLTADGVFGPASRAAWTGTVSTNYPAGCTSSAGFSPITGVSCSTGVSTTLPAGCSSTSGFSSTTGLPCSGTTSQTGPVTVALSSNNPASSTLVAGQATANLANFTFSGSGSVTAVTLQRIGVSADDTASNVYLFDGATRLTDAASVSNTGTVTFNMPAGIFTVNGTKTISVKSDIKTGSSGQTIGMMLATVTAGGTTSTVNLSGNIHSIATVNNLASVSAGTVTPIGGIINPGANVTVWQSTLNISNRDVWMKRFSLRNVGSAPTNAFANFKLYVNGVQVSTAAGLDANGYVTFDMTNTPVNLVSGSRVVRVDADIVSGASRTVHFSLRNAADADFVDSSFGVNVTPLSVPGNWISSAFTTISGTGGGSMTVEKDASSPSANVTLAGNDVTIGVYKLTAFGEPIKVETLTAGFAYTDFAGVDNVGATLRNGKILVSTNGTNWVQYGSNATLLPGGTTYTVNYTVNPGSPVWVKVNADMFDNDGLGDGLEINDKITSSLIIGNANAQKVDSLGSVNVPTGTVTANQVNLSSASVSVTKNGTYANQSVSLPATAFKVGSWNVAGSSVEDVLLTTASFDIGGAADDFDHSDLTNMSVVVKNASGVVVSQPSPLATVNATGNSFSINYTLVKNTNVTVEIFANIGSGASNATNIIPSFALTGTASVSGTSVAPTAEVGQTITVGTASITASQDASTPVAAIVHDNQTVTTLAAKFAAVTAAYNVTDLTLTVTGGASVVQTVELYDGATLVASQPGAASVTFNGLSWNVPANTNKVLTVKLVLSNIGIGAGSTGATLQTAITAFTATNTSSGVSALGTGTATGTAMYAYAAIPTISNVNLDSTVLTTGTKDIYKFSVTSNGGTIGWKKIIFNVTRAIGGTDTLSNIALYDVATNTVVATGGAVCTVCANDNTSGTISFVATNEQQISGSKTYVLRADIAGTVGAGDNINVNIAQPSGFVAPAAYATVAGTGSTFTWTDTSIVSHGDGTLDWNNDYLVKVLPTSTQTLTASN